MIAWVAGLKFNKALFYMLTTLYEKLKVLPMVVDLAKAFL